MASTISSLVSDFRAGRVDEEKVRRIQRDGYSRLSLGETVRPSLLRTPLRIDSAYLRRVSASVRGSPLSSLHPGEAGLGTPIKKADEDASWASKEDLKPWEDACTKWCTRNYFPDAFSRVTTLLNVIRLFDALREEGEKVRCVFKGGVMIRLVLLEFLQHLPIPLRERGIRHMTRAKALSVSDLDFEIVPDSHSPPASETRRLLLVTYACLLWLMREMQAEIDGASPPNLLSLEWRERREEEEAALLSRLQEEADSLPPSHPLHGVRVDAVSASSYGKRRRGYRTKGGREAPTPRRNLLIFDCDGEKCVLPASDVYRKVGVRGVPTQAGEELYSTLNYSIGADNERKRRGQLVGVFHLARIKHAFVVHYTTRDGERRCDKLGGEMIDLSQSDGVGRDEVHRLLYSLLPHPYKEYPILGVSVAVVRSYSPEAFLVDHSTMIHNTEDPPWAVKKGDKRIARYSALLVACAMSPHLSYPRSKRITSLSRLVEATSSLSSLSIPLRTGVEVVDSFARRERESLLREEGGERKKEAYLRKIHTHLSFLVSLLVSPSTSLPWSVDRVWWTHLWHTDLVF